MYPLFEIGPLRLSSGGLLLVAAAYLWGWLFERVARGRGGDELAAHAAACAVPALIAAALGGRLWYGLLSLELYGAAPGLFLAPRLAELAWPGALLAGGAAGWLWARRRGAPVAALVDAAALALPPALALAALGMLLSGEAFGTPTSLPWAVPLFGAMRHPTQLYYALAALAAWLWLRRATGGGLPAGALAARLLVANGLAMLLVEALRADALTLAGGVRATQLFGLAALLAGLWLLRPPPPADARARSQLDL
jgi:phosphatidylglycerol---prolipoprotein diacylglyceryl transferase